MVNIKIMVTGSRDFQHPLMVFLAIYNCWWLNYSGAQDEYFTIIEGACPTGADKYASMFAKVLAQELPDCFAHKAYPPNVKKYGYPHAFHVRNQEMVDANPNIVLAFLQEGVGNRGTLGTIAKAKKAGLQIAEHGRA